jgi:hypothetical protein
MFSADGRSEIYVPPVLGHEEDRRRHFQLVEQCFNVPLWHVEVLPRKATEEDFQRWSCYLVARARDVLDVVLGQAWVGVKLHVVLPKYMTRTGSIALARCTALWECETDEKDGAVAWLFETDLGAFVDPEFEILDPARVKKIAARWTESERIEVM